jgi:homocysteine S-methyltransferase
MSFSCRNDREVCEGDAFADAASMVQGSKQVIAVGVNCTPPQFVEGLLRSAAGQSNTQLLAYPNSGERWDPKMRAWSDGGDVADWRDYARRWQAAGARLIGGCCRTTPETIRQIRGALGLGRPSA